MSFFRFLQRRKKNTVFQPYSQRSWRSWFSRRGFRPRRRKRIPFSWSIDWIREKWQAPLSRRESRSLNRQKILLVILGALIFCLCAVLLFSKTLTLYHIQVHRSDLRVDSSEVEFFLEKIYRGKNLLMVAPFSLRKDIKKEFPSIDSVSVDRKWPHTLEVTVSSLPIVARVHFLVQEKKEIDILKVPKISDPIEEESITKKEKKKEEVWMLNKLGILEFNDPNFEKRIPLIFWKNELEKTLEYGETMIDALRLHQMITVSEVLLEQFNLIVSTITYYHNAREAHYKTSKYDIQISFHEDIEDQLKKLQLIWNDIGNTKQKYIDLRIKNRVIYR